MIDTLLRGIFDCPCGHDHTCEIEAVVVKSGAVKELPRLCEKYQNILLVADTNTYATCGEYVSEALASKLGGSVIFTDKLVIPNEASIEMIDKKITDKTDLILGIGSGVISDLCKYCSFEAKLPYFIVATAPSMDGYASVGAAMITQNMKTTFNAHVPTAIVGDVDILKDAPMDMIQSGYGDIIGKYSALNDWKLAHLINGESYCEYVNNLVYDTLKKTESLAEGIQTRDPETIKTLMEALVIVGIAMSFVGNSRPASGSEHHFSHYFEIVGILRDEPYLFHGLDVAYATIYTQRIREELLAMEEVPASVPTIARADWEAQVRKCYGKAGDGCIALQDKIGFYAKDYLSIYREKWSEIRKVLAEVPSSEDILHNLEVAGMDLKEFDDLYGAEKIEECKWLAKDLKDRYSVLWIYYLLKKGAVK